MLQRLVSYITQKGDGGPTHRLAHTLHCAPQVNYLLIPAEYVPDITLSYETACSVMPSISLEMPRKKKKKYVQHECERSHILLSERKSGYEQ